MEVLIPGTNPFRVSYPSSVKFQTLIFGLVGGFLIGVLQYTQSCFIVIEHSLEIFGALVGIPATPMQASAQTLLTTTRGDDMAAVTGFGGMFLRTDDPKTLYAWYEQHLGLTKIEGSYAFPAPRNGDQIVFSFFKQDNAYFPPVQKAMINLQVDDLDGLLDRLQAEGVTVDPERQSYDFGKFGWVTDPAGNRVELWEPVSTESEV